MTQSTFHFIASACCAGSLFSSPDNTPTMMGILMGLAVVNFGMGIKRAMTEMDK